MLGRPLPRPARPRHPLHPAERVRADAHGGGLLARRPGQRAIAARVRHRMADQGRHEGAPDVPRGGRAPRSPQARRRARPVQLPRADRVGPGRLPSQGRRRPSRDGGLLAPRARGRRLRVRQQPPHHEGRALRAVRAPRLVRGRHVPADAAGRGRRRRRACAAPGGRLLPEADELPHAQPHLLGPRTLVPRAAASPLRVRHRLPVREVRGRPGADPRPRVHPG